MSIVPSSEQIRITTSSSQRILVEANAGAAKTTTASMRVWELVNRGVDPTKIVALAFSEPGIKAYKNAFERIGMPERVVSRIRIGTVDEFCTARLKRFDSPTLKNFRTAREVRSYVLEAIRVAREKSEERFPGEFSIQGSGTLSVEYLLDAFSFLKGTLGTQRYGEDFRCTPSTAAELGCDYTSLAVFLQYEKERSGYVPGDGWGTKFRYSGDATYDMALHLLSDEPPWDWESHPLVLSLDAIILDEMHDCGWSMFTVIRHLLQLNPQAQFLGVGDRDQVIHGQNGADSYFMGPDLDRELGEVSRYPLTLTHRFGKDVAQPLATFSLKDYKSSQIAVTQVSVQPAMDAKDNASLIFGLINRHQVNIHDVGDDFAVLLRHPGTSVGLEHSLLLKGVPYQTVGFKTFLQRPEIAFVRMLLSIAVDHPTKFMPESLLEAKRAVWEFCGVNLPSPSTHEETERTIEQSTEENFRRYIFHKLLGEAEQEVTDSIHAAMEIAASNDTHKVSDFIKALNFTNMAQQVFVSKRDIEEATLSIDSFGEVARHYKNINEMLGAMNSIDFDLRKSSGKRRQIRLSTIEDAKGLEFRYVFIPDCNARTFDGDGQDERNLFYVAASRAKDHLVISYKKGEKSSYLKHFM